MFGRLISSVGLLAIVYEKQGGLAEYRKALWERLAFSCRYGNQQLDLVLKYEPDDIRNFNMALGLLIREENKTT